MNSLITNDVEMTSLDVAEIVGKKHPHVMRDIRNEIESLGTEIGQSIFGQTTYKDSWNRNQSCYKFGKGGAMQLALKYDAKTRYKVIKHIEELENNKKPASQIEVLQVAVSELTSQDKRITNLEDNMRINSAQEERIRMNTNGKVIQCLGSKASNAYKVIGRKAFQQFWRDFKGHFQLPRYSDLPKIQFDEGLNFIQEWQPNTSLRLEIKALNNQQHLKLVE